MSPLSHTLAGIRKKEKHETRSIRRHEAEKLTKMKSRKAPAAEIVTDFGDDDDREFTLPCRPRAKPKFRPNSAKVLQAFKEATTALEVLESYLIAIGSSEDVAKWMKENSHNDKKNVKKLLQHVRTVSNLLKHETEVVSAPSHNQSSVMLEAINEYFIFRAATKSVMLLAPVEAFKGTAGYSSKKVLGFIRKPGNQYPMMCAFPGWKNCAKPHERLLDSPEWTKKAQEFAERFGYNFSKGKYDGRHGEPAGTTYASHVEPKLMLKTAWDELKNLTGKEPHMGRLYKLRLLLSNVKYELIISEKPCPHCRRFQAELEELTGLKFIIKICPNLGQLSPKRDLHGNRCYGLTATDVSDGSGSDSESESSDSVRPLQLEKLGRAQNFEVQVPPSEAIQIIESITKSSTKKNRTIQLRKQPRQSAEKQETSLIIRKRTHEEYQEYSTPSRGTRSQTSVAKMAPLPSRYFQKPQKSVTPQKTRPTGSLLTPNATPTNGNSHPQHESRHDDFQMSGNHSRNKYGARKIKWL